MKKEPNDGQAFSHTIKVHRHRTDKHIIIAEGSLTIEDGCRIRGKRLRQSNHPPIKLKLEISEDDLQRMFSYACNSDGDFSGRFSLLLAGAIEQLKKGARGTHKGRENDVFHIKIEAGLLYLLFSALCNMPLHGCPAFFQKLVDRVSEHKEFIEGSGQPYPVMLTAYCLEEYYGSDLASLGLNPFFSEGFSHFFNTYIKPQSAMCKRMFLKMLEYKGVTHLKKTGTDRIFAYNPFLAARSDMLPCDKNGNVLEPVPEKVLTEEALKKPPCADILMGLGLL